MLIFSAVVMGALRSVGIIPTKIANCAKSCNQKAAGGGHPFRRGQKTILRGGSTDANVPMSLGLPAIIIGGGGKTGGFHSLTEWIDLTDAWSREGSIARHLHWAPPECFH